MKTTSKLNRMFKFLWLSHGKCNPTWDKLLNKLIDVGNVTGLNTYTITFDNKFDVWIVNHPYSSGHLRSNKICISDGLHCSKKTKIRFEDFVNNYISENIVQPELRVIESYIQSLDEN